MPFNGTGTFTPVYNWTNDANAGINIRADRMDGQDGDIATGLSTCITKNGQTTPTANLPMGTFKHTNVGNGSARTDYAALGQLQDSTVLWGGSAGGTGDAITITLSPAITSYIAGRKYLFLATANNTGATTLNVNGVGNRTIKKNVSSDLEAGDILNGQIIIVADDGTNFQLLYNLQGQNINMADKTLTRPAIKDGAEPVYAIGNVSGAVSIDYTNGHVQTATVTGNISGITVSNWPATGNQGYLSIFFTMGGSGSYTLTLSSAYKTLGDSTVSLSPTVGYLDELILRTYDAGTTILTLMNNDYR